MLYSSAVNIFDNILFLSLLWFTIFFKFLSTLSWFFLWTLLVISCIFWLRTNKLLSAPEYKLMLIITPLTIDDSSLMSFILIFSCLSWSNERLSVMCWLIFCTFNTENLNLWCFFFMKLSFVTCILQFWRMPSLKSERRISRQSQFTERMISQLYRLFSWFNLTPSWCINIKQSFQKSLIFSVHWFYILRVISVRSCEMKFWHELLLQ